MYRVWGFLAEYSLLLIIGAVTALIWANTDPHSYHHFVETPLLFNEYVGVKYDYWYKAYHGHALAAGAAVEASKVLTLHFVINDMLMALFFAIAGKEVWEAIALKNGSLRGKKALTPLIATSGGMIGPAAVYLAGAYMVGQYAAMSNGWAIPTATDIAFSYLVGRLVFGAGHPAVGFLLLVAIADDAAGLVILAVVYPQGELAPEWLLMSLAAAVAVYFLANRLPRMMDKGKQDRPNSTFMRKKIGFWPYLIASIVCWYGFYKAGVHPALGLLPIVLTIPHADISFGIFSEAEQHLDDLLNQIEHALKAPVEVILLMFGLANAGVEFSNVNEATWLVLAGLIIGKPLGIWLMGAIAANGLKLGLPEGMRTIDLFVVGCISAIGFTVSLFVASVAFPAGDIQDGAKMGALFSFGAAILSFAAGKLCAVEKMELPSSASSGGAAQSHG